MEGLEPLSKLTLAKASSNININFLSKHVKSNYFIKNRINIVVTSFFVYFLQAVSSNTQSRGLMELTRKNSPTATLWSRVILWWTDLKFFLTRSNSRRQLMEEPSARAAAVTNTFGDIEIKEEENQGWKRKGNGNVQSHWNLPLGKFWCL